MCGIVGFVSLRDGLPAGRLAAANTRLAHRGPDDSGLYQDPQRRAGVAMRRLAIIDLSPGGHQPMVWREPEGEVAIVFNGEIYNYRELRAECEAAALKLRGTRIAWRGTSDTEAVLWAYLLWGKDMLSLLDGMFAVGIWDGRSGRLLLARDRFGVKPLYWAANHRVFGFASEIKALLELDDFGRELDPIAIGQYVSFLYTPGQRTMLRSVRKLEPGLAVEVTRGGMGAPWRFARPLEFGPPDRALTEETAADKLRHLLRTAVHRQMVADVPVGAFLSGGLDSSSIVAFAREHSNGSRLRCFTFGRKGVPEGQEGYVADLPYAERVAQHLGVDLHTIWVGPEMAERFAWMVAQLDEPQADPASLNAYYICEAARAQGVKVLLSGAGGDDILTGYRRHYALMSEPYWSWLPDVVRGGLRTVSGALPRKNPFTRRLAKALQYADWPQSDRLISYFLWLHPDLTLGLLTPDFMAGGRTENLLAPMRAALGELPPGTHPINRMLSLDTRFFLADHNLNYTDKMSMAAGLEVRVPLLDPELVNFTTTLPPHFKQRGRTGKWIFKKAMEPLLPADVIYRPKTGFGVPLRQWLQHELRTQVDDTLSESVLRRRGIFDPEGVRRLIKLDREGWVDATYPIFALMCIETWCRTFVDEAMSPAGGAPLT